MDQIRRESEVSPSRRFGELQGRYWEVLGSLRREQRSNDRYLRSHRDIAEQARRFRAESQQWQARYAALEHSASVRLMSKYRNNIERWAPAGTLRRRAYSRAVATGVGLAKRTPEMNPTGVAGVAAPTVSTIPMALQPEASIVIPVHNQWALTAGCLNSIASDLSAVGFEVIVVDDASTDETREALEHVVGVNVVRLEENQGFIGAVNAGIAVARGRFVVLLNNDTICAPGWLDALVRTADSDENIGVVGAKLVYPDGRLQEAGGIIWNDASGHNYGRDQDPNDPRYGFVRDVDYCSGACLLVRRELLAMIGGLDVRFSPAYYEDTDLCFAARAHGYRVLYQPAAVICHLEGASNGTDVTSGVKAYQVTNQSKFQEKWAEALVLQGEPAPASPALTSWRTSGRVLVIDHQIPMPDQDSGSHRMFEILVILKDLGLGVTFVPNNGIVVPHYRDALLGLGIEVLGGPGDLDGYLAQVGSGLDLVVLSRPTVAWANYPMIRSLVPATTIVYDTVDLHYLREVGRNEVEGGVAAKQSAEFHYGMELSLAKLTDQTWTVSPSEKLALLAEVPDLQVEVVPNVHRDEALGPAFDQREGILFVGNYAHLANRDGAQWLVQEILPLVRAELPDVQVHLVGSNVTPEISALASDGVIVHGWVPEVDDIYHRVRLSVAPLRFGAGQKGKVGESLAFGVPVVTTPVGAQGFELENGREAIVAESAQGLADGLISAYRDRELWAVLSASGRTNVSKNFSPASIKGSLERILSDLGVSVLR